MTPENKVKEYIERAKEILHEKLPHGDTYGEFITGSLTIAQMLQREEHFNNSNQPHTG